MKVGFIGRLVPQKGAAVLVEAVRHLVSDGRPFSLRVIGEGPELQALAAEPWLTLLGSLSHDETLTALRDLNVLVVPSLTTADVVEQFGRVVVEAMAAGIPVLTSGSGALPEVVGDSEYVVHENNAGALAERLRRFEDCAYRQEASEAAFRRYNAHYRPDVLAERLMGVWKRAVDRVPT